MDSSRYLLLLVQHGVEELEERNTTTSTIVDFLLLYAVTLSGVPLNQQVTSTPGLTVPKVSLLAVLVRRLRVDISELSYLCWTLETLLTHFIGPVSYSSSSSTEYYTPCEPDLTL